MRRWTAALLLAVAWSIVGMMVLPAAQAQDAGEGPKPAILIGPRGRQTNLFLPPDIWRTFPTQVRDSGRVLLLSDNPEYVSEPGIMYRDTVEGKARLYLYHATRGPRALRYAIILRNHTDRAVTVTITRKGSGGPSTGYAAVGQAVLERFWSGVLDEKVVVPPGEQRHLDPDLIYLTALDQALVHAIYDIETDGPLEVAFVADDDILRLREPNLDQYKDMLRPPGERMRGTFPTSERYITFPVGDRSRTLPLANNLWPDEYLWGVDGVDGTKRQNYGNYGVTYHIDIPIEVTEPRRIRFYLGPAYSNAGSCALYATVLLTEGGHHDDYETGVPLRLPASRMQTTVALLGETVAVPGDPRIFRLDFIPPGGSCLPALLFAESEAITAEEAAAWYAMYGESGAASSARLPVTESGERVLPPGVLFFDNFAEQLRDWEFTENPAFYEDEGLVIPTFGFTNGFAGDRSWTDYALEVRFRIDELGEYGGMRLFVRNQRMWVSYGILFTPTGTYVDRLEGAWDVRQRYATIGRPEARVKQGVWHTARVEVKGNEIRVSLDGVFLGAVRDPDNLYPTGDIGFRTENSKITIDYVRVEEID